MILDMVQKFKGHLKIETIDVFGNVVDKFEDPNMIMDTARISMAKIISGVEEAQPINAFILGTQGHDTDILNPKDAADGFVKERTQLFSEESGDFTYPIVFDSPLVSDGECTVISELDDGSTVHRTQAGTDVTYTINIPVQAGNNTDAEIYTEAALYAGGNIFSMKTFKGKIKDDSVSLRVTWKIAF